MIELDSNDLSYSFFDGFKILKIKVIDATGPPLAASIKPVMDIISVR